MPYKYDKEDKFLVTVDCVLFGFEQETLKVLLTGRNQEERRKWSLAGGFLKKNETLDGAASRVLYHLTGKQDVFMEQLYAFNCADRDPMQGTVAVAYVALINIENIDKELILENHAQWHSLSEVPPLIFDHNAILKKAIQRLQRRIRTKPVAFELLPEKFSFRRLQKLYEAILNRTLDKRNFVSKIKSLDILIKLNEMDMGSSTKKSYLYKFKRWKYFEKNESDFYLKL